MSGDVEISTTFSKTSLCGNGSRNLREKIGRTVYRVDPTWCEAMREQKRTHYERTGGEVATGRGYCTGRVGEGGQRGYS
jgi:hypothetical protein